jgi:two-component system OmpR family response regulator
VLVVDDDPVARTVARIVLERHANCQVWATDAPGCTPHEAVSFRPDLLILDLELGDLDGVEVLRRLRQCSELSTQPALFCTALDEAEVRERLGEAASTGVITKPFTPQHLAATVQRLLGRERS